MIPSVLIAIPTGRSGWSPDFAMSLLGLVTQPLKGGLRLAKEPVVRWCYHRSSALPQNRHNLVREAQKMGVSHLLFLDDDMTFPADTLGRLLARGALVAAANCTTRALPIIPTAVKNDQRVPSAGKTGIELVDQVGCAVMLIDMKVFDRVPLPWFKFEWDEAYPDTYCSEDMYFCKKVRAQGIGIAIDHDLSQQIGHVGEMEYAHSMIDPAELAEINAKSAPSQHIKVA